MVPFKQPKIYKFIYNHPSTVSLPRYTTKICDTASATFSVTDADSSSLQWSILAPLPGTVSPSTGSVNTPISGSWSYVPIVEDVETVVAAVIAYYDSNNMYTFCPIVQKFEDITCDDIFVKEIASCKNSKTPKVYTIQATGDSATFTNDCTGSQTLITGPTSLNITIPVGATGSCTLSATLQDVCYGERYCDRTLDQRCCTIGLDA